MVKARRGERDAKVANLGWRAATARGAGVCRALKGGTALEIPPPYASKKSLVIVCFVLLVCWSVMSGVC